MLHAKWKFLTCQCLLVTNEDAFVTIAWKLIYVFMLRRDVCEDLAYIQANSLFGWCCRYVGMLSFTDREWWQYIYEKLSECIHRHLWIYEKEWNYEKNVFSIIIWFIIIVLLLRCMRCDEYMDWSEFLEVSVAFILLWVMGRLISPGPS